MRLLQQIISTRQSDNKQAKEGLQELYNQFDANGNDKVEIRAVKEIVRMIDPDSTDEEIVVLFKAAHSNNNGP